MSSSFERTRATCASRCGNGTAGSAPCVGATPRSFGRSSRRCASSIAPRTGTGSPLAGFRKIAFGRRSGMRTTIRPFLKVEANVASRGSALCASPVITTLRRHLRRAVLGGAVTRSCSGCQRTDPKEWKTVTECTACYARRRRRAALPKAATCRSCGPTAHCRWVKGLCGACYGREQATRWRAANPEKSAQSSMRWRAAHPEKRKQVIREWAKNHREQRRAAAAVRRKRVRSTPRGCLDHRMSVGVRNVLRTRKGKRSWEALVGYTVSDLIQHLEHLFLPDMTWALLLRGEIEIDHVRPLAAFRYTSADDAAFKECWALSNLRPLWKHWNREKSARLDWRIPELTGTSDTPAPRGGVR